MPECRCLTDALIINENADAGLSFWPGIPAFSWYLFIIYPVP
jgi:hypothetical protein